MIKFNYSLFMKYSSQNFEENWEKLILTFFLPSVVLILNFMRKYDKLSGFAFLISPGYIFCRLSKI